MKAFMRITMVMNIFAAIIILSGCSVRDYLPLMSKNGTESQKKDMSVWVVYWDLDGAMEKISALKDEINGISYFAAYFDENNSLFIPEGMKKFKNDADLEFEGYEWEHYLTLVNDKLLDKGSSLKDTGLLRSLFSDEAAIEAHIGQIMDLAAGGGYDGIEIDYEAIRQDKKLWEQFIAFCERLYQRAESGGLKLRVVLEPNAPLEELSFPEGPEYVMMCYNLYGAGPSMGPKANDEFLSELTRKMELLPGKKSFALATGGYSWKAGDEKGTPITEKEASALAESVKASVYRSENSGALTFQYRGDGGSVHTVWYADQDTLRHWRDVILQAGDYNIMLWRIE